MESNKAKCEEKTAKKREKRYDITVETNYVVVMYVEKRKSRDSKLERKLRVTVVSYVVVKDNESEF